MSFAWIVTKLELDTLHPHSAEVTKAGPATQEVKPGARIDIPEL